MMENENEKEIAPQIEGSQEAAETIVDAGIEQNDMRIEDEVTLEGDDYKFGNASSEGLNNNREYTQEPVTVQSVEFPSFDSSAQTQGEVNKNLDLLMDVKLQLSVELGRAELPIKKVLELTRGSIIELDKIAGEPVELFANGKLVAHGEVVVIEDNFGLRITSIYESEDRMRNFQ